MVKVLYYIIQEKCIGCGACVLIAKNLFEFDEKGKAKNIKKIIEKEEEIRLVKLASESCPTSAIVIEEVEE